MEFQRGVGVGATNAADSAGWSSRTTAAATCRAEVVLPTARGPCTRRAGKLPSNSPSRLSTKRGTYNTRVHNHLHPRHSASFIHWRVPRSSGGETQRSITRGCRGERASSHPVQTCSAGLRPQRRRGRAFCTRVGPLVTTSRMDARTLASASSDGTPTSVSLTA